MAREIRKSENDDHQQVAKNVSTMKSKPTLEELVSAITKENSHAEIDFGKPEGKELW